MAMHDEHRSVEIQSKMNGKSSERERTTKRVKKKNDESEEEEANKIQGSDVSIDLHKRND